MGTESEEEDVELPWMEIEWNIDLPGVDGEGKEALLVFEIDDPGITPDSHTIESETATKEAFEVPASP